MAADLVILLVDDKLYGSRMVVSTCQEAGGEHLPGGRGVRAFTIRGCWESHPLMSFQGLILPMLSIFSRINPASSKVNVTLAAIAEVPGLQEYLVCRMRLLTECAEMRDPSLDDTDSVTDWDMAIHVISTFFNVAMDRFYSLFDAVQARAGVEVQDTMVEIWQVQMPVLDGRYHSLWSTLDRLRKSL
ncbi:unnamed protein product [Closterium sp. NIES-64]|nr:unnamed protein product [Closterium sp. NIES-64]